MANPLFAVIGDPHIVNLEHLTTQLLRKNIEALKQIPELEYVLVTGDITHQAKLSQFELAKNMLDELDAEVFCCAGNHDSTNREAYCAVFGPERYITIIGNYNLIVLPPDSWKFSGEKLTPYRIKELQFVNQSLSILDNKLPSIILKHQTKPTLKLFKKYNTAYVFQGHEHNKHEDKTVDGIRFITCPAYSLGIGKLSNPITYEVQ